MRLQIDADQQRARNSLGLGEDNMRLSDRVLTGLAEALNSPVLDLIGAGAIFLADRNRVGQQ